MCSPFVRPEINALLPCRSLQSWFLSWKVAFFSRSAAGVLIYVHTTYRAAGDGFDPERSRCHSFELAQTLVALCQQQESCEKGQTLRMVMQAHQAPRFLRWLQ